LRREITPDHGREACLVTEFVSDCFQEHIYAPLRRRLFGILG
jgi:hypothetical protein